MPAGDERQLRQIRAALTPYRTRSWVGRFQLVSGIAAYGLGWAGAAWAWGAAPVLVPVFALVVASFLMRLFIIFHDCGHGSFSSSKRTNDVVGTVLGMFVFTPFRYWNYAHAMHHATSSDLDRRHVGDVWTMTVAEYLEATPRQKLYYRLYHHPFVLLTVGSVIKFVIIERIVTRPATTPVRVKRSVHLTNVLLLARTVALIWVLGPVRYLAIELLVLVLGGSFAIWFFYVQHRFEDSYWSRRSDWDYSRAALDGSSYLSLDPVLQFVSGNIGFHHLHHLDARIPNYNLARCHRENPQLEPAVTLTLRTSLAALRMKLWDEASAQWVDFPGVENRSNR